MNIINRQLELLQAAIDSYERVVGPDSLGFVCYACDREYDNFALEQYGRDYQIINNHKICDLCYDDWGKNGNFGEETK